MIQDKLLTVKQVAELMECSPQTVARLAKRGDMPAGVKLTPRIRRWPLSEITNYIGGGQNAFSKNQKQKILCAN